MYTLFIDIKGRFQYYKRYKTEKGALQAINYLQSLPNDVIDWKNSLYAIMHQSGSWSYHKYLCDKQ